MAGPAKQFDRDSALAKALKVFWSKGFEATSMQDLVEHMGVNRASLYETYGNKQALYAQALDAYVEQRAAYLRQLGRAPGSPLAHLKAFLKAMYDNVADPGERLGCFVSNSAVELGPHDAEVAARVREFWSIMENAVSELLKRARAAGEVGKEVDARAMARLITMTMQGAATMSKAGVSNNYTKGVFNTLLKQIEK